MGNESFQAPLIFENQIFKLSNVIEYFGNRVTGGNLITRLSGKNQLPKKRLCGKSFKVTSVVKSVSLMVNVAAPEIFASVEDRAIRVAEKVKIDEGIVVSSFVRPP
jgi:hypothetical protein